MTNTPAAWAVRTHGLRKTFRHGQIVAVSDLDLEVPRGGVHALLGPNGSGKTTVLRMLLGLIRADSGTMEVLGHAVPEHLPDVIHRMGAIVESPKFFPTMSAQTNLTLLARGVGVPTNRVAAVLEQVGLAGRAHSDVGRFSLGMKQRLAIAATLLKDPELLIFDEPTNGLDPAGIHEIRATMRDLADAGKTVIVSSHILAEVQQVADSVSIIGRGRLLRAGAVADLVGAGGRVRVVVNPSDAAARVLMDAGFEVSPLRGETLVVGRPGGAVDPTSVARVLGGADLWPSELTVAVDSLEQVFLTLTEREHLTATQREAVAS